MVRCQTTICRHAAQKQHFGMDFVLIYMVFFLLHFKGTMSSRGKMILMADADGATKFSDIDKVEAGLNDLNPKPVRCCSVCCVLSPISAICGQS